MVSYLCIDVFPMIGRSEPSSLLRLAKVLKALEINLYFECDAP